MQNRKFKIKVKNFRHKPVGRAGGIVPRNGSGAYIAKFILSTTLLVTSEFLGLRHVVFVGDNLRAMPFSPFEFLCELVWAKHFAANGYLTFRDCETAAGSEENFYQLAYRVRRCLGGTSFLELAPKRYRLPFLPENIQLCPKIIEMADLNPKIAAKLQQCLVRGSSTIGDGFVSSCGDID